MLVSVMLERERSIFRDRTFKSSKQPLAGKPWLIQQQHKGKHSYIFQGRQISLALRARAILLAFEQFTRANWSQILLEILWFLNENL